MDAYKTIKLGDQTVVVFLDERFAAAFRALAYAWEEDSPFDALPQVIRDTKRRPHEVSTRGVRLTPVVEEAEAIA